MDGYSSNPATFRAYTYTPDKLNWSSVNDNGYNAPFATNNNGMNQYTSINGSTPQYDPHFNLYRFGGFQYDHDAPNRLVAVSGNGHSASFTYDGLGRCVRRTVDGVTRLFTYDGWNPIMEWDQAGNWKAVNIYGPGTDEILGRYDAVLGPLIYKQDKQGNVTFVLNGNNQTVEKYSYDAYGTPKVTDGSGAPVEYADHTPRSAIGNRFMYTGREYLQELGIYDYRHRYYLPSIGRFLQTDPLGLQTEGEKLSAGQKAMFSPGGTAPEAFGSSEMNLFRYVGDDPVDKSDPSGLADVNYAISDDWTRAYNPEHTFVIVGHGNPLNGLVVGKQPISATQIARDAVANGYNAQCTKVELVICGAGTGGKDSLAQKVANALAKLVGSHVEASAPNGKDSTTGKRNDQTGVITPNPPSACPDPKFGSPGKMEVFKADPPKKDKKD